MAEKSGGLRETFSRAQKWLTGTRKPVWRPAAELVSELSGLLLAQLEGSKPNVEALAKTFDPLERECFERSAEEEGASNPADARRRFRDDLVELCRAVDAVLSKRQTALFKLLPCVLFLYFKLNQLYTKLNELTSVTKTAESGGTANGTQTSRQTGESRSAGERAGQWLLKKPEDRVPGTLARWLCGLASMPVEYDSLLMRSDGFTPNCTDLMKILCEDDRQKGLFLPVLRNASLFSDDAKVLGVFFTFLRLDMKYIFLCKMAGDDLWRRYMDLDWRVAQSCACTPGDFSNRLVAEIGHCIGAKCFPTLDGNLARQLLRWMVGLEGATPAGRVATLDECWIIQASVSALGEVIVPSLDRLFTSVMDKVSQSSDQLTVSARTLVAIAGRCGDGPNGVMDTVLQQVTVKNGLSALLELLASVFRLEECTPEVVEALEKSFRRIDLLHGNQTPRLDDVWKFYDDSETSKRFALHLLLAFLQGKGTTMATDKLTASQFGELVDKISSSHEKFVLDNFQHVLDCIRSNCSGFFFDALKHSEALRKLVLPASEAVSMSENLHKKWRLPPVTDLTGRYAGRLRKSQQKLVQKCLAQALEVVKAARPVLTEGSLAYVWWCSLCQAAKPHMERFLQADRSATIADFTPFLSTSVEEQANPPILVWIMCSELVPMCLGCKQSEPWVVTDADNILLGSSKSAHSRVVEPGEWHPSQYDGWLAETEQSVTDHHQCLSKKTYSAHNFQTYSDQLPSLNKLFVVFNLEPITSIRHPGPLITELRQRQTTIDWLRSSAGVHTQELTAMGQEVTTLQNSRATYGQLEDVAVRARAILRPLAVPLHTESGRLAEGYLQEIVDCRSALFRTFVSICRPGNTSLAVEGTVQLLRDVDKRIRDLLTGEITLAQLAEVSRAMPLGASITGDVDILRRTSVYGSVGNSWNLSHTADDIARTMEYITHIPAVIEVFHRNAKKADSQSHIQFLTDLHSQFNNNQSVNAFLVDADRVNDIFSSMSTSHLALLSELQACGQLLSLCQETGLYADPRLWAHLRGRMTLQTRNNPFKTEVLDAFISVHGILEPLFAPDVSLQRFLHMFSQQAIGEHALEHLRYANSTIAHIRKMMRQAQTGGIENALSLAEALQQSGVVTFHLNALKCQPSHFDFSFKISSSASESFGSNDETLNEDEVLDLRQQLQFCKCEDESREEASRFLDIMDAVESLRDIVFQLEKAGDNEFQAMGTVQCSLSDCSRVKRLQEEYQDRLRIWQTTLKQMRSSHPAMRLFSDQQIGQLLTLLTPGRWSRMVMLQMCDNAATTFGPLPDAMRKPADREINCIIKCVCKILLSSPALGVPASRSPETSQIRRRVLACFEGAARGRARFLDCVYALVESLISPIDEDPAFPAEGKQEVCSVISVTGTHRDLPSSAHTKILAVLLEEGSLADSSQLLFCSQQTTEHVLQQFFDRANSFPGGMFLLVGVDRLNQTVRQLLSQLQQDQHNSDQYHGTLCYVFLENSVTPSAILGRRDVPKHILTKLGESVSSTLTTDTDILPRPRVLTYRGVTGAGKSKGIQVATQKIDTVISINDVPDVRTVIRRLNSLPSTANVHFNISAHAPLEEVDAIFFQLLVLGTLVDPEYGTTFSLPLQSNWTWWVEVPHNPDWKIDAGKPDYVAQVLPVVAAFAVEQELVRTDARFHIGDKERFVAKYVAGYEHKNPSGRRVIDENLGKRNFDKNLKVYRELSDQQYQEVLERFGMLVCGKAQKTMFISCLRRRFNLFDKKMFLYHVENQTLGSDLLQQFKSESLYLCQKKLKCSWQECKQKFCIPDSAGGSFYPLYPGCGRKDSNYGKLPDTFRRLTSGGEDALQLDEDHRWESYLRWTLNLEQSVVRRLLQEKSFLLLPDFAYKMLLIHERKAARLSLIIEGETGVGKTFLLEMYALLLNAHADTRRGPNDRSPRLLSRTCAWLGGEMMEQQDFKSVLNHRSNQHQASVIQRKLRNDDYTALSIIGAWKQLLSFASSASTLSNVPKSSVRSASLISSLQQFVLRCYSLPLLKQDDAVLSLAQQANLSAEGSSDLLTKFLATPLHPMLWRLLIHPGIKPTDVENFLHPIIQLASKASEAELVVFFDEINTAGCLGLFKEILCDKSLNGVTLPDNIFFVGAINPYLPEKPEKPVPNALQGAIVDTNRQVYFVRKLPEAMDAIQWKYGSLHEDELQEYICRRIGLMKNISLDKTTKDKSVKELLTAHQYCQSKLGERSVSQRDINRVFRLLPFFLSHVAVDGTANHSQRFFSSLLLAIAVVYYLRLPEKPAKTGGACRSSFSANARCGRVTFSTTFSKAVDRFVSPENFVIQTGIALNQALKENVFALVACILSKVPLGIIGPPGSSKTLSTHIVRENLLGRGSPTEFCKQFDTIDCLFYQCSEHSTSAEIDEVFRRAVKRQAKYDSRQSDVRCMVLLDEAGLPKEDESNMVLKVLHQYLDECGVSFVAISNRPFDSANQNRMVTVSRSLASRDDLLTLARGCIDQRLQHYQTDRTTQQFVEGVCQGFLNLMESEHEQLKGMFHYRDLIYLFRFIYCRQLSRRGLALSTRLLLEGLERNFNGVPRKVFQEVVQIFFTAVSGCVQQSQFSFRAPNPDMFCGIMDIVRSAFKSQTKDSLEMFFATGDLLAPRFKMVIDPTDDMSAFRLLQQYGILDTGNGVCHAICMSNLAADCSSVHAAETIAAVKYYVERPATIILLNCARIYGHLYDLLNQNFFQADASSVQSRALEENGLAEQDSQPGGVSRSKAFANIAMGSVTYNCPVNPHFQCVVFLRESDLLSTQAPFLSRFEKYLLPVDTFLELEIEKLCEEEQAAVKQAYQLCQGFVKHMDPASFYGFKEDNTLPSLFLSHIRPAKPDQEFARFELMTPPLKDLAREPHFGIVLQPCSTLLQKIVRCVCAELLQLLPPEVFLQKLSAFSEAHVYAHIYFYALQNQAGLSALLKKCLPSSDTLVKQFKPSASTKSIVFTRASGIMQSLPARIFKELDDSAHQYLSLECASDYDSKRQIEEMLKHYESSQKTCCLITVNPRKVADLRIWHQLISQANTVNSEGISKSFILLFHVPPIEVHSSSCYTASFLNGWNCLFLDTLDPPPSIRLSQFSPLFVQESENRGRRQRTQAVSAALPDGALGNSIRQLAESNFVSQLEGDLAPCPALGVCVNQAASMFYNPISQKQKEQVLRNILKSHPQIWHCVKQHLYSVFSDANAFRLIRQTAVDIVSRKVSGSMAMEVCRRIQDVVFATFGYVMLQLCNYYGLAMLPNWSEQTVENILRFIPPTTEQQLKEQRMRINCDKLVSRIFLIQTPLFTLIHNHVVKKVKLLDANQHGKLRQCIASDEHVRKLFQSEERDRLLTAYCNDCLLLDLYRKSIFLEAESDERKAVGIVIHWLRLNLRVFQFEDSDLLAVLYWARARKMHDMKVLFEVSTAVLKLGCSLDELWLQNLPSNPQDFSKHFMTFAQESLWNKLCSIHKAQDDEWPNVISTWNSAFDCVETCLTQARIQLQLTSIQAAQRSTIRACSRLLRCVGMKISRQLSSAAPTICAALQSQSGVQVSAMIQPLANLARGKPPALQSVLIFALLDLILFWIESKQLKDVDITPILRLLNGGFLNCSMSQYRQFSVRILEALYSKATEVSGSLERFESHVISLLNYHGSYVPVIHPDYNQEANFLAHVYFDVHGAELKRQRHSVQELLARQNDGVSTMYHSVRQTATRLVLIEHYVEEAKNPLPNRQDGNRGTVFDSFTSKPALSLTPPSVYSLYMLRTIEEKTSSSRLQAWLKRSDANWCRTAGNELTERTEAVTGPSFLYSESSARHDGFGEVYQLCCQLREKLQQCVNGNFASFVDWCKSKIRTAELVRGIPTKELLKGLLLLVIYYDYFRLNRHGLLHQLWHVLQSDLSGLDFRDPMASAAFRFFLVDSFRHGKLDGANFRAIFDPSAKSESDVMLRDVLVNFFIFTFFLQTKHPCHWRVLLTNPEKIIATWFFGATSWSRVGGGVNVDCCSQFELDGQPKNSAVSGSNLSCRAIHVSALFSFAALLWLSLLVGETEPGKVLTPYFVNKLGEAANIACYKQRIKLFCFTRVSTLFVHIGSGSGTSDYLNYEKSAASLSRCLEKFTRCCVSGSTFQETYATRELLKSAEVKFELDAVVPAFRQALPSIDAVRKTTLQTELASFHAIPVWTRVQFGDMCNALVKAIACSEQQLEVLNFLRTSTKMLETIALAPRLMKLFSWLLDTCSGQFKEHMEVSHLQRLQKDRCVDEGMSAFNEYHTLHNGQIRPGPCHVQNSFPPCTGTTTLSDLLKCLSIMLVNIFDTQTKLFSKVNAGSIIPDAPRASPDALVFEEQRQVLKARSEIHEGIKVENLDVARKEGLVCFDRAVLDQCVQCYGYRRQGLHSLDFEWLPLQNRLSNLVTERAYNITDVDFIRKPKFAYVASLTEFEKSELRPQEQIGTAQPQFMIELHDFQRQELRLTVAGHLDYDLSLQAIQTLAKVHRSICQRASAQQLQEPNQRPLHECVIEVEGSGGMDAFFLSRLEYLRVKLCNIKSVHALICTHLESMGYLHIDLPEAIRMDMAIALKTELERNIDRHLSSATVDQRLQQVEATIKALLSKREAARVTPDRALVTVLDSPQADANALKLKPCFPDRVKCQNLAASVSVLVKTSHRLYCDVASNTKWNQGKSSKWTDYSTSAFRGRAAWPSL